MSTPSPDPLRTLIVDPSAAFRDGVARWAADRPDILIVGISENGSEALEAVDRLAPDLVLVDAVLPVLDGFHVIRSLKSRAHPPIVVVVTFMASSIAASEAFSAGADGFIPKDDFTAAFELLLGDLIETRRRRDQGVRCSERSARRGSRIERDP